MKDELWLSIRELNQSVSALGVSVNRLCDKWEIVSGSMLNSIPLKSVFWMFLILVLAMGGIKAIEIVSHLYGLN